MINLQNISFGYKKNAWSRSYVPLFESLDFQMEAGNIYGLLGKNGAGKTTLLKIIAGLIFPKDGEATVMGFTPKDRHPDFLADLYFIHEEMYVPELTVQAYENLYAPFYPRFDHAQFDAHLNEFGLTKDKKMKAFSYGQKKKVLLSFGLASNCRLLILDEPTNGLDIPSKSQFRKLLATSITDDRVFIISTHQVRDMSNLIDPIVILENGKIIFQENIIDITQKLSFNIQNSMSEPDGALYSERVPGGYRVVSENFDGDETDVDIEALFNTVVTNKEKMNNLFSNTQKSKSTF